MDFIAHLFFVLAECPIDFSSKIDANWSLEPDIGAMLMGF